jgi:DNA-binding protein HU-beta
MTEIEWQDKVAKEAGITKAAAGRIINHIGRLIIADLLLDGKSRYPGLGIFTKVTRAARTFHNPKTQEPIEKPARHDVKFKLLASPKKQIEGS